MSSLRGFLRRHGLVAGLVLMFAFTWPIDLAQAGLLPFQVPFALYLFLGWGFIAAALLMTGLTLGRAGVAALLKRFPIWRVGWRWYAVAFLLYPAIFVISVALNAAWTGTPVDLTATMAAQFFGLLLTTLFHAAGNTDAFFLPMANMMSTHNRCGGICWSSADAFYTISAARVSAALQIVQAMEEARERELAAISVATTVGMD